MAPAVVVVIFTVLEGRLSVLLIERAAEAGFTGSVTAPVYLGDSLQLRYEAGDLLGEA